MSQELPTIKSLVADGKTVRFVKYHDGALWYTVDCAMPHLGVDLFEFPVPIADIGNATFLARDKAMLFMRYIRKHLQLLKDAKEADSGQT